MPCRECAERIDPGGRMACLSVSIAAVESFTNCASSRACVTLLEARAEPLEDRETLRRQILEELRLLLGGLLGGFEPLLLVFRELRVVVRLELIEIVLQLRLDLEDLERGVSRRLRPCRLELGFRDHPLRERDRNEGAARVRCLVEFLLRGGNRGVAGGFQGLDLLRGADRQRAAHIARPFGTELRNGAHRPLEIRLDRLREGLDRGGGLRRFGTDLQRAS